MRPGAQFGAALLALAASAALGQKGAASSVSPALLNEPPAGAFVAARGWDRVEFSNESDSPVRLKAYLRLPKTGKWRQFQFPKDSNPRPRFFKPNSPLGKLDFPLAPGDRVGWVRFGRAEMAFQILDSTGEDVSASMRFRAERPTVTISKPDSWMHSERAEQTPSQQSPGQAPQGYGASPPPGMNPSPQQGMDSGMGSPETSGPADRQPD